MAKVDAARGLRRDRRARRARASTTRSPPRRAHVESTGATFVHAFDDPRVIAGQGTLGLELAEQLPPGPGTVVIPIGGGGLAVGHRDRAAGAAAGAVARRRAGRSVCAVRRAGRRSGRRSRTASRSSTRPSSPRRSCATSSTRSSSSTTRRSRRRSCCCSSGRSSSSRGPGRRPSPRCSRGSCPATARSCAVLAGGNIDATTLISVTRFGLTSSGRYLVVAILIPDRPGQLARIVAAVAAQRANVLSVTHHREGRNIGVLETEAELTLETRGEEHSRRSSRRSSRTASRSADWRDMRPSACTRCDRVSRRGHACAADACDARLVEASHLGQLRPATATLAALRGEPQRLNSTVSPPRARQSIMPPSTTGRAS